MENVKEKPPKKICSCESYHLSIKGYCCGLIPQGTIHKTNMCPESF